MLPRFSAPAPTIERPRLVAAVIRTLAAVTFSSSHMAGVLALPIILLPAAAIFQRRARRPQLMTGPSADAVKRRSQSTHNSLPRSMIDGSTAISCRVSGASGDAHFIGRRRAALPPAILPLPTSSLSGFDATSVEEVARGEHLNQPPCSQEI